MDICSSGGWPLFSQLESVPSVAFRNFNLCPHCQSRGRDGLLCRLFEGVPMISRSDGTLFHLFLADQPLPYPAEKKAGRTDLVSVCFGYAHARSGDSTHTSVVVLRGKKYGYAALYRNVEYAADLLAAKLQSNSRLSTLYQLDEDTLVEALM
jgi:hypothetical protein